ncbi:uncharacterized protein LOC127919339 isoform X10 [Oncorhynchus keta]|uniref:uncharacterized protein LOC127919339 isoform X10 n=1 Tax=Oncorhynchus keta TaxID=8018 RepID=UPI00227B5730|nr:uncharacterized protein LOC127919339 isoform X10 [Oncorhynchus keta]
MIFVLLRLNVPGVVCLSLPVCWFQVLYVCLYLCVGSRCCMFVSTCVLVPGVVCLSLPGSQVLYVCLYLCVGPRCCMFVSTCVLVPGVVCLSLPVCWSQVLYVCLYLCVGSQVLYVCLYLCVGPRCCMFVSTCVLVPGVVCLSLPVCWSQVLYVCLYLCVGSRCCMFVSTCVLVPGVVCLSLPGSQVLYVCLYLCVGPRCCMFVSTCVLVPGVVCLTQPVCWVPGVVRGEGLCRRPLSVVSPRGEECFCPPGGTPEVHSLPDTAGSIHTAGGRTTEPQNTTQDQGRRSRSSSEAVVSRGSSDVCQGGVAAAY